jgi:hypothetical protein
MPRAHRLAPILLCPVLFSACASAADGPRAGDADYAVAVTVSNQSRTNLLVYLARPGERGMKLGSVNALDMRAFRVRQTAAHAEMYLYAMPLTRDPQLLRSYESTPQLTNGPAVPHVSAPFLAPEATSVRWTVLDGQRLSGVTLR